MEINKLYNLARNAGITVDFVKMPHAKGVSVRYNDKDFVAIDKDMGYGSAEEKVTLAHEIGHCETGAFYDPSAALPVRQKPERQADRWAIKTLVPESELENAVKNGCESVASLAEFFGVTEAFMQKAIRYYCENKTA